MARWSGSFGLVVAAAVVASLGASSAALAQVYVPPGGWSPSRMPSLQRTAPAVVVGQVVDAVTGRGIPNAIVHLGGSSSDVLRVADILGRFYFVGLHGGRYSIAASKPGYLDGSYGQRRAGGDGLPVDIAEHEWLMDTRVALWRSATLTGVVTDEAGEPLIGVHVEAERREYVGGALQLATAGADQTDDRGMYRISDLLPGNYIVAVPSALASDVNAVSAPPDFLDAIVRSLGARPDASGTQLIVPFGSALPLPPGSSQARLYPSTYHPGTTTSSTAIVVTLGNGEERGNVDVHVTPSPAVAISGDVTGPDGPIAGQVLRLLATDDEDPVFGRERAVTTSATSGKFVFPEVPAGDYVIDAPSRVHLMVAGPSRIDPTDAAAAASLGVSIVPDPQDNVPDGKPALWGRTTVSPRDRDLAEVKVAMQPGATVSGQIVFETTQGPPSDLRGLSIDILANGRSIQRAAVDDSGLFAIHGLAPGSYFVAPDQTPPGWFLKSATSLGRDLLSMPLITTAGENVADLVVTLTDRPTEILGTVSDARYYPIASASVIAFPAEPASPGSPARSPLRVRSVRTSAAGVFHLVGLPLGDYLLVAIDDAAANGWQDPARLDALRASAVHVSLHDSDPRHQDLQILTKR